MLYLALSLAILVVLVAAVLGVMHLRQIAEMRVAVTTQNMALSLDRNVEAMIDTIDFALLVSSDEISRQLSGGHPDKQSITSFLTLQQVRIPHIDLLRATDEKGDVIYGAGVLSPLSNISDRDYFFRLRDDSKAGLVISKPIIGKISKKWSWLFARRINKPDGSFGGVVYVSLFIDELEKVLTKLTMDSGSVAVIRDAEFGLIARYTFGSKNSVPFGDKVVSKPFEAAFKDNPNEGTFVSGGTSIDHISRTQSYSRNAKYCFIALVGIAGEAALSEWRKQATIIAGLVTLFALTSTLFAWRISLAWRRREQDMVVIQKNERHLRESQQVAKLGSWDLDLGAPKLEWSDETYKLFDQSPENFSPSFDEFARLVHPDDRETMQTCFAQALASDTFPYHVAVRIINESGRQWVMEAFGAVKRDINGKPLSIHGTAQDITERKQAEARLRLSASVFANSYDGVTITDANHVIIDVNPAFTRITGYAREEIIGQTPKILASGRQSPEFYAGMWKSLQEHDFWHGEIWNRRKSGEVYAEMLSISVIRDDADQLQHYIGVFSDISQLKAHEAELHRIAHYDVLTGVPNRRLLADRLGQAIARARRNGKVLAVCYLDLDGFKPINDQYGHATGDQLLIEITERLKGILRAEDTLARLGGDEFVLLFTDLTQFEESLFVLDRVLAAVSTPVVIGDIPISVSASIGVTLFPTDDADADTLLRHADQAMYLAKEAGKNRYHLFDPERDRQVQSHRNYLQRLREALDNSEFVLHYQPKVNLVTGAIIGAEALIRWQHPDQGLLPPGDFLHYLDGSDLELTVGEWVIDSVLKQIKAWNDLGLNLTVSANVSANHLLQGDFADRLVQMLERHPEVASGNLELEILETAALANMDQAVHVLTRCRQLGVHLSLDDFGTGYSSLTYFRNLPVDILKIDQSFVRDMLDDPDDLGIVESVIRLAHAFNRPVIAEGVETLDHGAMLVHLECQLAQGYGIARPMPAEQMPDWVSQWRSKAAWLTLDNRLNTREDVMLMVAAQRHRKWIDQIAEHLDHPNDELETSQDSAHCRFGHWYRSSGTARYGQFSEFQAIDPLHETVHVIAAGILGLARDGQVEAARNRLHELYATSDQLLAKIELLIQKLASEVKG